MKSSKRLDAFTEALKTKTEVFLGNALRHVLFESAPECTDALCLEILSKCHGITSVGTTNSFCGPVAYEALGKLRNLRRMATSLCEILPLDDDGGYVDWSSVSNIVRTWQPRRSGINVFAMATSPLAWNIRLPVATLIAQ